MNYLVESMYDIYNQYQKYGLVEEPDEFAVNITPTTISISTIPFKIDFVGKASATIDDGELVVVGQRRDFYSSFLCICFGCVCGLIAFIIYKLLISPLYWHIRYSR